MLVSGTDFVDEPYVHKTRVHYDQITPMTAMKTVRFINKL